MYSIRIKNKRFAALLKGHKGTADFNWSMFLNRIRPMSWALRVPYSCLSSGPELFQKAGDTSLTPVRVRVHFTSVMLIHNVLFLHVPQSFEVIINILIFFVLGEANLFQKELNAVYWHLFSLKCHRVELGLEGLVQQLSQ